MAPLAPLPARTAKILSLLLIAPGCGDDATGPGEPQSFTFTFEESLEGWTAEGTDLDDPPVTWSIERTEEASGEGDASVRLFVENVNDAAKIWLQRGFDLEPGRTYRVTIELAFGTSDWGDVNLWRVIAGAHTDPPQTADDLTFQDDTGHDMGSDAGVVWQERSYTVQATSGDDGTIWVSVGVWGTWETQRTYYVDDLTLTFEPV